MYIDNISIQFKTFMYSVGFGFLLGFVYDIFRLIRIFIIKRNNAIFAQDLAYSALCSILTFSFLLVINNGRFRFSIFVALVIGFIVYYALLSNFFVKVFINSGKIAVRIINVVSQIITVPISLIINSFGKIWKKSADFSKNIEKKLKNKQNPS